ncbi:hypothetical protein A33I_19155 [Alkalihalophilus marmarensis DSM 21297]|uniref:Uncharacterized protein n=1 Tax=Alkalihalophilus marmarensis DSM 21297 TaxID=1188261 RepID=U6SKN8_9BACI|nr:hypothetical protein A33I_19155 [Alkalihalophilus marmarensis DSM 21297]
MRSRSLTSFDSPFFPAGQGAAARQERRRGSVRYESDGGLTMRSAFCFVWQSEADDCLNSGARQRKAEETVLACGKTFDLPFNVCVCSKKMGFCSN